MKEKLRILLDYLYILIGTALSGFAVAVFYNPAALAPGGISGVATIINHTTGFSLGLGMLLINIPIYISGVIVFGKKYGLKTLIGTLSLPLFTLLFNQIFGYDGILDYSKDISFLLSAIFGGLLTGLGIGIVMKSGSNTGGTDIIGQIVSKFTHIGIGTSLLIINVIIIASSAFVFGLESALYSVIACYLDSYIVDRVTVFSGTGYAKTVYIISDKLDEIGKYILEVLSRSGTVIDASGLFTKVPKPMIMTVIPNRDLTRLVRFINKLDPDAFVIVQSDFHVLGKGYKKLSAIADNQDVTQAQDQDKQVKKHKGKKTKK